MKNLLHLITVLLLVTFTLGLLIPAISPLWWISTIALIGTRLVPRKYFE